MLYAAGGVLVLSGLLHLAAWLVSGGSWEGPLSLRKPVLFGLSAGVTLWSMGWLLGKMRRRWGDAVLLSAFGVAMLVEVSLITVQQWRGVPSHFNSSTPFDAAALLGIEVLIVFATLVIVDLTVRSFGELQAPADMQLAIRSGMLLLLLGCLLGFVMVGYGHYRIAQDLPPGVFGKSGVMKFAHGTPLHAIQFLPAGAWLLRQLRFGEATRWRSVAFALGSMVAFTAYSLVQTFSGLARFEMQLPGMLLMGVTLLLMAAAVIVLLPPMFSRAEKAQ